MAEALEKWPVHIMQQVQPRILQIIQEIDRRFVEEKQGKWNILNGKEKIAEKGEVKDKKGDQFSIVDANGNRHQIKKVDENTIEYQPFTSDGISATNGKSFKFKKEK